MQTIGQSSEIGAERQRIEAVVQTLATLRGNGETLAEVAHDARNMVTALGLYCDLLEEPGVLSLPFLHYGSELRLVAAASRRLVEKLVALDSQRDSETAAHLGVLRALGAPPLDTAQETNTGQSQRTRSPRWDAMPPVPIDNLSAELLAARNLLAALAGPSIAVTVDVEGGARPVWLTAEDLTRVLVNLVKNASEALPPGGRIQIGLRERPASSAIDPLAGPVAVPWLTLTVEDNGPGIPPRALEKIFASGYTTRAHPASIKASWPAAHRGLGLSISRSLIEGARGLIHAENRAPAGARFEIQLPVRMS
jgi:signal transduction histidine kinase